MIFHQLISLKWKTLLFHFGCFIKKYFTLTYYGTQEQVEWRRGASTPTSRRRRSSFALCWTASNCNKGVEFLAKSSPQSQQREWNLCLTYLVLSLSLLLLRASTMTFKILVGKRAFNQRFNFDHWSTPYGNFVQNCHCWVKINQQK